jgi:putative tricarboxylic transport membrane protein
MIARTRVTGAVMIAFALAYGFLARGYVVTFIADPLGPRAAPWLLSGLMLVLGVWLLLRPDATGAHDVERRARRRVTLALFAFLAFAVLLSWTGFILTTALLTALLAWIAGGPPVRAAAAGGLFGAALYYIFVFALDVPLPIGRLFPFLGG